MAIAAGLIGMILIVPRTRMVRRSGIILVAFVVGVDLDVAGTVLAGTVRPKLCAGGHGQK